LPQIPRDREHVLIIYAVVGKVGEAGAQRAGRADDKDRVNVVVESWKKLVGDVGLVWLELV
jgi:hypothetical protein